MIEYNDKKSGKIKVANVTEARANFADVLSDTNVSYVVTKNNKPVRAIIDYEDFVLLRKSQQSQNFSESLESDDFQEMGLPCPDRRQKSKSRVRGLLGTHQELLRQKPSFEEVPESKPIEVKIQEEVFVQKKVAARESPAVSKNYQQPEAEDYFQTSDEDYLISPEEVEVQESAPVTPPPAPVTKPQPQPPQAPVVQKNPEEQEYFDKYKKLYGTLEPKEEMPGDLDRQVEERVEQLLKPKLNQTVIQTSIDVAQKFKPEPKQLAQNPVVKEKTVMQPQPAAQPKNNMPSLKDLLRELDNEKLSIMDEDEELALNDEIDDLINRITQD